MKCLFPPFDNPVLRRAPLGAVDQTAFMTAVIGADPSRWTVSAGFFPPNLPKARDDQVMDDPSRARRLSCRKPPLKAGPGIRALAGLPRACNAPGRVAGCPRRRFPPKGRGAIQVQPFVDVQYTRLGAFYPSTVCRSE